MPHQSARPNAQTRTASTLAEAVEIALTEAPDHHAVVVVEVRADYFWRVEIIPAHLCTEFVRKLQEGFAEQGVDARIEVWEQHIDVEARERASIERDPRCNVLHMSHRQQRLLRLLS